jgi:hypothetical protein
MCLGLFLSFDLGSLMTIIAAFLSKFSAIRPSLELKRINFVVASRLESVTKDILKPDQMKGNVGLSSS